MQTNSRILRVRLREKCELRVYPGVTWAFQANSGQIPDIAESSLSSRLRSQVSESAPDEGIF
jgi:hypothetical protein